MTWTYDPATALGRVRLYFGDTDTTDQLLSDAEVGVCTTLYSNEVLAAAAAADIVAAKFARKADTSNGSLSVSASQRAVAYSDLANKLRARAARVGCTMSVGGVIESENDTIDDDDDLLKPAFTVGMHSQNVDSDDELSP